MDLQNQNLTTPPQKDPLLVQFKGSLAQNDDLKTPKVRKPYTITKQREKWTDEEHNKFLEALKLYGRAWRQIEEFICTKTAVQIRSHAQKFFSKVVRGGNDDTESPVEAIEIPPPRPKRKPTHPYPRKYVDPQNSILSPSFQPEKRICPQIVTAENQSPNSVLAAAMTHMLEFPVSDMPDSCLSSSSCSTGLQSGSLFSVDKKDNSKAISSIQNKNYDIVPVIERSASLIVDNSANMGIKSFEKEGDLPEATIMLFGQIVSTNDSKRHSTDREDTITPSEQHLAVNAENEHRKPQESPASNGVDTRLSHGLYYGNWMPWSWHETNSDTRESRTCASIQWMPLPLYTGLPPPYLMSCSQDAAGPFIEERRRGKEEDVYVTNLEGDAASPKCTHKSGFVPYKRCSAAGSIKPAKTVAEEDDGQRIRLCL
ncbi:unnamed protein product [Rhodiola kirilowii]